MTESDDIQRLLVHRETIARFIAAQGRVDYGKRITGLIVLIAFVGWLVFALWNGAVGLTFLQWAISLSLLAAFVLTRRVSFFGEPASIFHIVMSLMSGTWSIEYDSESYRQRLAECDAKIAALRAKQTQFP